MFTILNLRSNGSLREFKLNRFESFFCRWTDLLVRPRARAHIFIITRVYYNRFQLFAALTHTHTPERAQNSKVHLAIVKAIDVRVEANSAESEKSNEV